MAFSRLFTGAFFPAVIPGWSEGPDPESRDSGFASSTRPGMTAHEGSPRPESPSPACGGGSGWGLSRYGDRREARSTINQAGFAAVVENSLLRRRIAIFHPVLIKHVIHHRIRRTVIPSRIVIEVESDRRDRASADIRTLPTAGRGQEFNSDFEIRVFHQSILA